MLTGLEILSLLVPLVLGLVALYWIFRLAVRDGMSVAQRRQHPQDQTWRRASERPELPLRRSRWAS